MSDPFDFQELGPPPQPRSYWKLIAFALIVVILAALLLTPFGLFVLQFIFSLLFGEVIMH